MGNMRRVGITVFLALVLALLPTPTNATERNQNPLSYRYNFCNALDRYDAAITDWLFPTRQTTQMVVVRRQEAWRAIKAERRTSDEWRFSRDWYKQHYQRYNLTTSTSWQNSAMSADMFISRWCYPLIPTAAPVKSWLNRYL